MVLIINNISTKHDPFNWLNNHRTRPPQPLGRLGKCLVSIFDSKILSLMLVLLVTKVTGVDRSYVTSPPPLTTGSSPSHLHLSLFILFLLSLSQNIPFTKNFCSSSSFLSRLKGAIIFFLPYRNLNCLFEMKTRDLHIHVTHTNINTYIHIMYKNICSYWTNLDTQVRLSTCSFSPLILLTLIDIMLKMTLDQTIELTMTWLMLSASRL